MENHGNPSGEKAEFGPVFARIYSFFAARSRRHRVVYDKISEDIASLKPSTVLEIGSGPGIAAAMIGAKIPGVRVHCVDPSPTMVKIANIRFRKLMLSSRVESSLGNSSNTGIGGDFDVIFSSLSFHHWKNGQDDLIYLAERHMTSGTMIIYENLLPDTEKSSIAGHGHGLTKKDIENINVPGTMKTHEITGTLVALKFTKV